MVSVNILRDNSFLGSREFSQRLFQSRQIGLILDFPSNFEKIKQSSSKDTKAQNGKDIGQDGPHTL